MKILVTGGSGFIGSHIAEQLAKEKNNEIFIFDIVKPDIEHSPNVKYVDGDIFGDSNLIIKGLCGIDDGKEKHISYIYEKQYFKYFLTTQASAIIINHYDDFPLTSKTLIKVDLRLLASVIQDIIGLPI